MGNCGKGSKHGPVRFFDGDGADHCYFAKGKKLYHVVDNGKPARVTQLDMSEFREDIRPSIQQLAKECGVQAPGVATSPADRTDWGESPGFSDASLLKGSAHEDEEISDTDAVVPPRNNRLSYVQIDSNEFSNRMAQMETLETGDGCDKGQVRVFVAVRIIQIGVINMKEQWFKCRFNLFIEWNWKALAEAVGVNTDSANYDRESLEPIIRFPNSDTRTIDEKIWTTFRDNRFVGYRVTVEGDFRMDCDLSAFPFDVQRLTIELQMGRELKTKKLLTREIAQFRDSFNHANILQHQTSPEYGFLFPRYELRRTGHLDGAEGQCMSKFILSVPVVRKYRYYIIHLYALVFSFQLLAFGMFAMKVESENRLILIATIILVFVAFKMDVMNSLPKTQEMTQLDSYIYVGQAFFFLMFLHAFISLWTTMTVKTERRCIAFYLLGIVVIQIIFAIRAVRAVLSRMHKVGQWGDIDDQLLELIEEESGNSLVMKNKDGDEFVDKMRRTELINSNSSCDWNTGAEKPMPVEMYGKSQMTEDTDA